MENDSKRIADFLGINRDEIENIDLICDETGAIIRVKMKEKGRVCPSCGFAPARFRGYVGRSMKSPLLGGGRECILEFQRRKYLCPVCGRCFCESLPGAAGRARVDQKMVAAVLEGLSDYSATFVSVARDLSISPTAVADIFDRYYNPRRKRLPEMLCIDECYLKGCFGRPYALVLLDWADGNVVDIIEGRDKYTLSKYLFEIPEEERLGVKVVCMDMWPTYLELTERYLKNAVPVVDSFHVMKNLTAALDAIRRRVMNSRERGSDGYHYLKHYGWTLFKLSLDPYAPKRRDPYTKAYINPWDALQRILELSPDLRKGRDVYVEYRVFNSRERTREAALDKIAKICSDIESAEVGELFTFMATIQNWRAYIANSFGCFAGGRRVTNGPIEGFNSKFKLALRVSGGMGNFDRFRAKLILCNSKVITLSPKSKTRKRVGKKRGAYNKKKPATE